jgi:hypothetical protein
MIHQLDDPDDFDCWFSGWVEPFVGKEGGIIHLIARVDAVGMLRWA